MPSQELERISDYLAVVDVKTKIRKAYADRVYSSEGIFLSDQDVALLSADTTTPA